MQSCLCCGGTAAHPGMNVSATVEEEEGEMCWLLGMWQCFCSIINGVGAHRLGRSRRGAAGTFSTAPAKPPAVQPPQQCQNPHGRCPGCRGTRTGGLWDRLPRGWNKALRAHEKVPDAVLVFWRLMEKILVCILGSNGLQWV